MLTKKQTRLNKTTPPSGGAKDVPGKLVADNESFVLLEMTAEEWIGVPGHPRQRDTAHHAKARHWLDAELAEGAAKSHLHHVTGAILDGGLYKVDGHTRAYLWETGKLPKPDCVFVTAYRVQDTQELLDLYKVKDVATAADTPRDQVVGALREQGYTPESRFVASGLIATVLHIVLRGVPLGMRHQKLRQFDIYKAVAVMLPEIIMLDQLNPKPVIFKSGVASAALILFALEKQPAVIEFFQRINLKQGEKRGGKMDPVESVLSEIEKLSLLKGRYKHNYLPSALAQVELCGRCIRASQNWLAGPSSDDYWRSYRPAYVDVMEYVKRIRSVKIFGDDDTL